MQATRTIFDTPMHAVRMLYAGYTQAVRRYHARLLNAIRTGSECYTQLSRRDFESCLLKLLFFQNYVSEKTHACCTHPVRVPHASSTYDY